MKQFFTIPKWLFVVLVLIIIFRIPNLFEPYYYGDETIYLALGEGIRNGLTLYRDIHDNKPPLLYDLAALAGSLFLFKAILMVWMLFTTVLFWKLALVLFPKNSALQKISTIIFAIFTTIPLFEGPIANAELFMVGLTIGGFLLLLTKKYTIRNIFLAGILFSLATLFKVPAAFDVPAIIFLWIISTKITKESIVQIFKKTFVLTLGFTIPITLTFIWYYFRGAFHEYLVAAWLQNFGYLSSFRPEDIQKPFLEKNGPLLIRAGIVAVGMLILFVARRNLSKQFVFICAWLLLSLFAITLSERPYPHYIIQAVPAVSLLLGILFTLKNLEQALTIIPLTLFVFVPVYFHFWHYRTLPYYTRFVNFALGNITREEYLRKFGSETVDTYAISEFIASSTKPRDSVFVWGSDSSNVYALSKRLPPIKYVATYHIKDFSSQDEVIKQLSLHKPELVVTLSNAEPFPLLTALLEDNYGLAQTINGTQIWKLLFKNNLPN